MGIGRIRDVAFARRGWLLALLVVFGAAAISLVLTGRQIWLADWGLIDDHEIFYFLGDKLHLPFSEIVSTVLDKTEVGSLQGRFRPSYYFLRVVKSWAWGRDVHLWYAFGTAAFAFFLGAVRWVIARFLGLLPAALCMVPIAFAKFWGAVWGRLGPAEIYAAPATGLMLLGCYELFFAPSALRRNLGCAALTIGTVILIGTKETLLPLAVLALFYVALAVIDRRLTALSGLIAGAIMLSFSFVMAWIVLRQLAGTGADIYGNSVSPAARLKASWFRCARLAPGSSALRRSPSRRRTMGLAISRDVVEGRNRRDPRHLVFHARLLHFAGAGLRRRVAHGNAIRFSGNAGADFFRVFHRVRRQLALERNRGGNIGGCPGGFLRGHGRASLFGGRRHQGRGQILRRGRDEHRENEGIFRRACRHRVTGQNGGGSAHHP